MARLRICNRCLLFPACSFCVDFSIQLRTGGTAPAFHWLPQTLPAPHRASTEPRGEASPSAILHPRSHASPPPPPHQTAAPVLCCPERMEAPEFALGLHDDAKHSPAAASLDCLWPAGPRAGSWGREHGAFPQPRKAGPSHDGPAFDNALPCRMRFYFYPNAFC